MKTTPFLQFSYIFLLLTAVLSCQSTTSTPPSNDNGTTSIVSKIISVDEFEKGIANSTGIQLIDVRTPEEVAEGTIKGAVNHNFHDNNFQETMKSLDPTKPTYVYCKSGGRSGKTAKILMNLGFQEVYDLAGGYTAWKAAH